MADTTLQTSNLVRSLTTYWDQTFAGSCPIIFPDMQQDASQWESWIEWAFPVFQERIIRETGLKMVKLTLDLHCFAVRKTNLGRGRELVDQVRQLFAGKTVIVRDFALSTLPAVGYVKFGEAEVRDLSRIERLQTNGNVLHYLVSFQGLAQVTEV